MPPIGDNRLCKQCTCAVGVHGRDGCECLVAELHPVPCTCTRSRWEFDNHPSWVR